MISLTTSSKAQQTLMNTRAHYRNGHYHYAPRIFLNAGIHLSQKIRPLIINFVGAKHVATICSAPNSRRNTRLSHDRKQHTTPHHTILLTVHPQLQGDTIPSHQTPPNDCGQRQNPSSQHSLLLRWTIHQRVSPLGTDTSANGTT